MGSAVYETRLILGTKYFILKVDFSSGFLRFIKFMIRANTRLDRGLFVLLKNLSEIEITLLIILSV